MNAKDAWLKQVKYNRKRLKGLPRVGFNPNAGNVEHNIKMFNHMNDIGDLSNNPISGPFGGDVSAPAGDGTGMAMGESLNKALQTDTAYMLRNDGEVFKLEEIHPYIMNINTQPKVAIRSIINNPNDLSWFYQNTKQSLLKNLIQDFIVNCITNYQLNPNKVLELYNLFNIKNIETSSQSIDNLEESIIKINNMANQEFCRFRTSNELVNNGSSNKDIYFRISSHGFNWFNLIWDLVHNNRKWIESITIESDFESKGNSVIYNHNGHSFDHMKIEDFINLKGNPIIESSLLEEDKRTLSTEFKEFLKKHKDDFIENNTKNWISIYADAYVTHEESFIPSLTELILSKNKIDPLDKLNYVPEHYAEGLDQINLDPNDHTLTLGEHISGIGTAAFQSCQLLSEVTILEGCTTIGDSAFRDCPNLVEVTIPSTIKYIGKNAFADCWQLTDVYYNGDCSDWERININGIINKDSGFHHIHCLDDDYFI